MLKKRTPILFLMMFALLAAVMLVSNIYSPTAQAAPAATQILGGTAAEGNLRISILDDGTINVERYASSFWVEQIYEGDSKGSRLQSSDGAYRFGGQGSMGFTGIQGTTVSNSTSGNTVTTVWTAGATSVTQRITYNDGNNYFQLEWDITNTSGAAITDMRFFHGEDTYLSGGDNAAGFWVAATNTIGAQKTVGGDLQRMMLQGVTTPHAYQSEIFSAVAAGANAGALTNAVNTDEAIDNGYALEWRQATLNAGDTWNIVAYEKFTTGTVGALLVIAPTATDCEVGTSCDLTYTVQNDIASSVNATFAIAGDQATWNPTITSPGASATIPGNSSISVVVQVTVPAGTANGTIGNFTLTANDGTTDSSDTAAVQAIVPVVPEPEIDVRGNDQSIANGSTTPSVADDTDFGNADVSSGTVAHTFAISNTGDANLNLTSLIISDVTHFSITSGATTPVGSGAATTFEVTFNPTAAGYYTATVSIVSSDSDENPYTFVIAGTGTIAAPEIDVRGNGQSIANGSTTPSAADDTDFGNADVSSGTVAHTFTISNTGDANLDLTSLIISDVTHFSITSGATTPVGSGAATTFEVTFDPTAAGYYTTTISITSNDSDENPYTFVIAGTGIALLDIINLDDNTYTQGLGAIIIDNDVAVINGIDFSDGYLKFDLTNSTVNDQLNLTSDADPNADGAISVVGTDVYLGNGTSRDLVGSIDVVENGQNGQPLVINFASPLENGSFEDDTLVGWDQYTEEFNASSTDYSQDLDGTPIDFVYDNGATTGTGNIILGVNSSTGFTINTTTAHASHGTHSLQLHSNGSIVHSGGTGGDANDGNLSLHGPYVASSNTFHAFAGDSITLDWMAIGGGDSYEVFGYLVQGSTYTLIFNQRGDLMPTWNSEAINIPAEADYSFLFVGGTYDQTGLYGVGADLYVDNIRLISAATIEDSTVTAIGQLITFDNTASAPATHTRDLEVSVETADARTDLETSQIFFIGVDALVPVKTAVDVNGAPLHVGDVIRYTIDLTNTNTLTMTNVVLTDTLPAGVTFDSATPAGYSGPNPLVWTIGDLAPGVNWTATIDVHVDGTVNPIGGNIATVNSDQQGEVSTTPILPPDGGDITTVADLEIYQSIQFDFLDTLFIITAQNNGPDDAPDAVVSVAYPAEIVIVGWECAASGGAVCPAASGSGDLPDQTLATFPSGGSVVYTMRATVHGTHTNTATITPPVGVTDPDMSNNESTQMSAYLVILPVVYNNASFTP